MADRKKRVKQGLQAVLKKTMDREGAPEETPPESEPASKQAGRRGGPRTYTRLEREEERPEDKRHTSVYLYPSEFEMLDDVIYELRKSHGLRVPKTDLWRALLHLASRMAEDPSSAQELVDECARVLGEK